MKRDVFPPDDQHWIEENNCHPSHRTNCPNPDGCIIVFNRTRPNSETKTSPCSADVLQTCSGVFDCHSLKLCLIRCLTFSLEAITQRVRHRIVSFFDPHNSSRFLYSPTIHPRMIKAMLRIMKPIPTMARIRGWKANRPLLNILNVYFQTCVSDLLKSFWGALWRQASANGYISFDQVGVAIEKRPKYVPWLTSSK